MTVAMLATPVGQLYLVSREKLDWTLALRHHPPPSHQVSSRNEGETMAADVDIDELLKQDEAALREKKKLSLIHI